MANSIDQRRRFTERFFRCPVNQDNLFETFCPILFFPLQRKKELSGCVVKYFIVYIHFAVGCKAKTPYFSIDRIGRGGVFNIPGRYPSADCLDTSRKGRTHTTRRDGEMTDI